MIKTYVICLFLIGGVSAILALELTSRIERSNDTTLQFYISANRTIMVTELLPVMRNNFVLITLC